MHGVFNAYVGCLLTNTRQTHSTMASAAATSSSSAAAAVFGSMALRAAIVGSGAAGLAAAKALCGAGMAVTVFEASKHVGGLWNYSDYGSTGVMYKSLHTNLPKGVCTHTLNTQFQSTTKLRCL